MTFKLPRFVTPSSAAAAALLALAALTLPGCGLLVVGGGAAAGAVLGTDRRSGATQFADQTIELKADQALVEALNRRGHISVVSYYRKVLLTGEVPTAEDRDLAQRTVAATPDVAGVINELAVMPDASIGQNSSDTYLTSKVKTALLNADNVPGNSIKVVTARSTVYLMGRLTRRETELATEATRAVSGVERVVRVIDFISEQSAQRPNDPPVLGEGAMPLPANGGESGEGVVTHPVK